MKFLALLAALLLEQARPLRHPNGVEVLFVRYARYLVRLFDGGEYRHGVIAWLLAIGPAVLLTGAAIFALLQVNALAAWLWSVLVLYVTMGLRQFSHHFTEIGEALRESRLEAARERLGRWRRAGAAGLAEGAIARSAIELALLASHRHVFGAIAWFLVAGAPGAVLYRFSATLAERWDAGPDAGAFGRFAATCFFWIDWVPARLTAASFAIAGNFEDAVYCWRTQAPSWASEASGIILASGAGALGVRLGGAAGEAGGASIQRELGLGDEADADYMRSAVGLVWRALVLWMVLVLAVTIAYTLG
jgi:cobalamin biosynthesis protein CobD/CbiB